MFIKRLDYLSPPVTFYHQGLLSHSSIISGIISVFSIVGIITFAVYFSLDIIYKNDPKTFSFNSFIEDAGMFPINASSLFHFISMASLSSNYENDGIDFTSFNIIGFEDYYEAYLYNKNLTNFNHWLYGKCNNQTDTEGISYLIIIILKDQLALGNILVKLTKNITIQEILNLDGQLYQMELIINSMEFII